MYKERFTIRDNVSNNAFHFHERIHRELTVAPLKKGTIHDVQTGEQIAFEDYDDEGSLRSCAGLKNFIVTNIGGAPAYIFDNHNHAFAFWCLEFSRGAFRKGATLIHIDQHKDTRVPVSFLEPELLTDPEKVFHYTNSELNVGNFIVPAQKAGLIERLIIIDSQTAMDEFDPETAAGDVLLDIDLDFFSRDMDYIENRKKVAFIKRIIPKAKVMTVATSPFFIEQERAIHWLRQLA